ncbi:MAG TPA: transporter substrate-binding domain-containing protein [Telmatospirillum sp.]|nr:transporter substrate-binding domain-containing protein [Telmatospirillum sp.]
MKKLLFCALALTFTAQSALAAGLRFVGGEIPPYVYSQDGKPNGAASLIVMEMARELGEPFALEFLPWKRAQDETQQNDNVAIIPLARNAEREPLYKWVGPIVVDQEVLITLAGGKAAPKSLAEAKDWSICTLLGSPTVNVLSQAGFTNVQPTKDMATCSRMTNAGRVDAWSAARMVAPYQYRMDGFDPGMLRYGALVRPNEIYMGLSPKVSNETVARWQGALEKLRANGKVAAILKTFE